MHDLEQVIGLEITHDQIYNIIIQAHIFSIVLLHYEHIQHSEPFEFVYSRTLISEASVLTPARAECDHQRRVPRRADEDLLEHALNTLQNACSEGGSRAVDTRHDGKYRRTCASPQGMLYRTLMDARPALDTQAQVKW